MEMKKKTLLMFPRAQTGREVEVLEIASGLDTKLISRHQISKKYKSSVHSSYFL